ncbi:MAG TPA: hypothetical protein VF316_16405 [Polyangiaceae bacterium]
MKPGLLLVLLGVGLFVVGALSAGGQIHFHARGGPYTMMVVGILMGWRGIFLQRDRTDEPPPP